MHTLVEWSGRQLGTWCRKIKFVVPHRFADLLWVPIEMKHSRSASQLRNIACGLIAIWLGTSIFPCRAVESAWIKTGATGRLLYVPDAEGDRILDFSNVGYRGKGTDLIPQAVANAVIIVPMAGDDTAQIQAAINQVSALPLGPDGFRGAVLLQPGTFDIGSQLEIRASGVVLRGSGSDAGGTVLHGRNPLVGVTNPNQRPLVRVYGNGNRSDIGSTRNMIEKVVPAGARSFRVDSISGFSVGDTVRIERPSTAAWIEAVGMDNPPDGDPPWAAGTMNIRYDRTITRIEGNRIFVDAPLANSFETQFGGGTIREYSWSGAINNIGIENLRGDTDFTSATDEDHAWEFISIGDNTSSNRAQNVWVRDIEVSHFGDSAVVANPSSKWVTVSNVSSNNPVSQITGERRYTFDLSGELGFVTNSQADEGRHDFVNNSSRPAGPNVFHNSVATNANNDSGPHQRWASGTLFDNITVDGDAINVRNRGSLGTTHGWTGSNMVIWNSTAQSFIVQNPPTTQNWLVGSQGTIIEDTTFGPQPAGYYDQSGPAATPVTAGGTTSLYEAQMNDAAAVFEFHDQGGTGNWTDASFWDQELAPLDSYEISMRDYLVGDIDGFTYDGAGSVDNAFIDPTWQTAVANSSGLPLTKLDDLSGNENVAFTVQHTLDPGERVVHASLALALRQSGDSTSSDFIRLFNMNPENRLDFSTLGWNTQLSGSETFVGVLDLGGQLANLQSGSVNVQINDDTGLDWALYTATVATPRNNASVTSVVLDQGGTVMVSSAVAPVGTLVLGGMGNGNLQLAAAGVLNVSGSFTQSLGGTLEIELDDLASGGLTVGGTATLGGTLQVTLSPGLVPQAGDEFELLSAASLLGTFVDTDLPTLTNGLAWNLNYASNSVALTVLYSADFNKNGTVDSFDLAMWQAAYGMNTGGNADGDGDTDGRDFLIWQNQFGSSIALEALATTVPEPSCQLLLISALLAATICRFVRPTF
ncbi:MAG: hypothetical protein SH868_08250 [Bythopirellula sp.]|nr:hypothetical protein [Bythopirellula sp.]